MTPIHLDDRESPRAPRKVRQRGSLTPAAGLFGWRKQDGGDEPKARPTAGGDYLAG